MVKNILNVSNLNKIIDGEKINILLLDIDTIRSYEIVNIHFETFNATNELMRTGNITISNKKYLELIEDEDLVDWIFWSIQNNYY